MGRKEGDCEGKTDDRDEKVGVAVRKFGAVPEGNEKGRPGMVALWLCGTGLPDSRRKCRP